MRLCVYARPGVSKSWSKPASNNLGTLEYPPTDCSCTLFIVDAVSGSREAYRWADRPSEVSFQFSGTADGYSE